MSDNEWYKCCFAASKNIYKKRLELLMYNKKMMYLCSDFE